MVKNLGFTLMTRTPSCGKCFTDTYSCLPYCHLEDKSVLRSYHFICFSRQDLWPSIYLVSATAPVYAVNLCGAVIWGFVSYFQVKAGSLCTAYCRNTLRGEQTLALGQLPQCLLCILGTLPMFCSYKMNRLYESNHRRETPQIHNQGRSPDHHGSERSPQGPDACHSTSLTTAAQLLT